MSTATNDAVRARVEEAQAVLRALGFSPEQHSERSALTLLALLNLRPKTPWQEAQNPPLGTRAIMDFIRDEYGKDYAPNTRESIRKLSLKPFVAEGILQENPDNPRRTKTSADFCYQIEPRTLVLLQAYGSPTWEARMRDYRKAQKVTPGKLTSRFQRSPEEIRLHGVRLVNFRSLVDTGVILLRPMVFLVGRNGSGKSSLLRFFPLLRQSSTARGSVSPLAWVGEDVDFGKLSVVQRHGAHAIEIGMTFTFSPSSGSPDEEQITYTALLRQDTDRDVIAECRIRIAEQECILTFGTDGALTALRVNEQEAGGEQGYAAQRESGSLIPRLLDATIPATSHWLAQAAPFILDSLSRWLSRFTASIHYARPVREAPVRLHRLRDQAVDQLDPTGANLAMFLMKLDPPKQSVRRDQFSRWIQQFLGFRVQLHDEGRWHVEIQIEEDGHIFNLVDMGYGYSQLLPVLLQCWSSTTGHAPDPQRPPPSFLAIEQPELHLHPAHQAKLADVFVAASRAVSQTGGQLHFLIETHSDTMLNRLGELIENGQCRPDEISILLFERDPVTGDTTVSVSEFDNRGYLQNWPVGFFSP